MFLALPGALVGAVILFQFVHHRAARRAVAGAGGDLPPFMKRITWWPQLFLGLAFSAGARWWDGRRRWARSGLPALLLYAGSSPLVIGYDTIYAYALRDVDDDALIRIRSTARLFGDRAKCGRRLLYQRPMFCGSSAALLVGAGWGHWPGP